MSFETILPFLRPIEGLICDPAISEIMVNPGGLVFVERDGVMEEIPGVILQEKSLQVAVRHIARALGDDIGEAKPILDSRLPDGSRVAAVVPPCSVQGTTLTIRKFQNRFFHPEELVRTGTLPEALAQELRRAVASHQNILISGGTSSGKTTLLNALATWIEAGERVVVIEDTSEIALGHKNLVRFEARREQPHVSAVTMRELLRATLRHRPDRILLGEVRGGEAFDLLQALNTGHAGVLSTIHANSAPQALARFTTCVLQSGIELPYQAIRSNIAEALHLLVHIERRQGARRVTELLRIARFDLHHDRYELEPLYGRGSHG